MTEVIILTSSDKGYASLQLKELVKSEKIHVKAVVLSSGEIGRKSKFYRRKLSKAFKIGPLGVLNGLRMRKWYTNNVIDLLEIESIQDLCQKFDIPFCITPRINCKQTIQYFKEFSVDVGLSLGNGFIGKRVFQIPRMGMINVHHEVLPDYQNAQSIIWQLYNNSSQTGFTIHKIDEHIDTGDILFRKEIPIIFKENLQKTVSFNYANLWIESAKDLVVVLEDFNTFYAKGQRQNQGTSYTTPGILQFMRILRNFRRMKSQRKL